MSISNPSHLLISRNPRSPAHPQLAPTLTSRHSPSASLPGSWAFASVDGRSKNARPASTSYNDVHTLGGSNDFGEEEEEVLVHPTFCRDAQLPGRVKVMVGRYEFWCHKEILWFSSPFFQSLLDGNWAETAIIPSALTSAAPSRRQSWASSSAPNIDSPSLPQLSEHKEAGICIGDDIIDEDGEIAHTERKASIYLDAQEDDPSVADILRELRELPETPPYVSAISEEPESSSVEERYSVTSTLLQPSIAQPAPPAMSPSPLTAPSSGPRSISAHNNGRRRSGIRHSFSSAIRVSARTEGDKDGRGVKADAVVELHEESASAFQDFLFWCYPHLECKVTWTNVENLLALSLKLLTPSLQKLCEHFLITHASGRPVMALMLAEQHGNAELFREASRFVLDQPTWHDEEMESLDYQTRLKLSQRRNWFLERLLKLGTIDVKREYTCRPDCPDPARCQIALDEKWRQAHLAVCRYGPPQPSVAFRCLRQLETFPTNPSLAMPHPLCQRAAQSWVMTLFDRMFALKTVLSPLNPGTEKTVLAVDRDQLIDKIMSNVFTMR